MSMVALATIIGFASGLIAGLIIGIDYGRTKGKALKKEPQQP